MKIADKWKLNPYTNEDGDRGCNEYVEKDFSSESSMNGFCEYILSSPHILKKITGIINHDFRKNVFFLETKSHEFERNDDYLIRCTGDYSNNAIIISLKGKELYSKYKKTCHSWAQARKYIIDLINMLEDMKKTNNNMTANIKIAKELVKLAKILMASDGGVDDLAKGIYECIQNGECSYSFYLPSGAIFCITDASVTDGYHECAIVSDFSYGMPTTNAYWFYDMNDINSIHEDDSLQDCRNTARQIFDLDKNYNFNDVDFEKIDSYYDDIYSGKRLGSKKWNDWFNEYDEYEITVEDVYMFMTQKLNYKELLNKYWKKDGIRCFEQAMEDAYEILKSDD